MMAEGFTETDMGVVDFALSFLMANLDALDADGFDLDFNEVQINEVRIKLGIHPRFTTEF